MINAPWYIINDVLYLNVPYIEGEIKKFSWRYAGDRMEEYPTYSRLFMRNPKTLRRLKRRVP
jgi:hypothetical protein